ncbi:hypothetical protein [Aliiruegeria lutimaris]|uniref:Uncharacterized protein n=1 Tax=Aliiruegeria lutimaris TaxID=571298 RepID=A0A1G9G9P3_9RHOB|nr:hypothetical protein [Aliiruegeria lutimaris]SDK97428.1 hypothetical protein SAMN04488026_10626 [Aliiruegeria lutimaris]
MSDTPYDGNTNYERVFETRADRAANAGIEPGQTRQRSYSIERRYRSGSIDRVHIHDNARSGNRQFRHVIGGWDRDGNQWGRNDI